MFTQLTSDASNSQVQYISRAFENPWIVSRYVYSQLNIAAFIGSQAVRSIFFKSKLRLQTLLRIMELPK
jgi:hypothetical protein